MNVCWYEDEELGIFFDSIPDVSIRYATHLSSREEIRDINKKPFVLNSSLNVLLKNHIIQDSFSFFIPVLYKWDGASIPRFFWRLIGSKTDTRFLIPSLIHDFLCENHSYIDNDRYFSTIVFERLLYVSGVNSFSRWMIKHSVDNYQKFCKWEN